MVQIITPIILLLSLNLTGIICECIFHQRYKGKSDVIINCVDSVIPFNSSIHFREWGTFKDKIVIKPPFYELANGSLLIKGVSTRSSHYFCKVRNIETKNLVYRCGTAVTIIDKLVLLRPPRNETVENNTVYYFKCRSLGGDLSIVQIKYLLDEKMVEKDGPFTITKDTKVECIATSGDDYVSAVGYITIKRKGLLTDEEMFLQTKCVNTTNHVCSRVIFENSSRIYQTYSSSNKLVEDFLKILFSVLDSEIIVEYYDYKCVDRFQRLVCSTLYPTCIKHRDRSFNKLPICRESCESVLFIICRNVLVHIRKHITVAAEKFKTSLIDEARNPRYMNSFISSLSDLIDSMLSCDHLPNRTNVPSVKACSLINLDVNPKFVADEKSEKTCYDKIGRKYIGETSKIDPNIRCLNWKQIPQLYISFYQQSLQNDSNYCRNPGGIFTTPMCAVNQTKSKFSIGFVPCTHIPDCQFKGNSNDPDQKIYIVIVAMSVVVIVFVIMSVFFLSNYCKRKRRTHKKSDVNEKIPLNDDDFCIYSNKYYKNTQNGGYACPIYNAAHFEKVQTLAYGEYGEIVLVQAVIDNIYSVNLDDSYNSTIQKVKKSFGRQRITSNSESDTRSIDDLILSVDKTFNEKPCWPFDKSSQSGSCTFAVIKYLSSPENNQKAARFNRETKFLSQLNHPFILRFYGVCLHISDNVICRIVEYLPNGDIKSILTGRPREPPNLVNHDNHNKPRNGYQCVNALASRGNKTDDSSPDERKLFKRKTTMSTQSKETEPPKPAENIELNNKQLIKWSVEICDAVVYLHTKHLIHRDIATRNCLIGCNLEAKLADFSFVQKFSYGFNLIGNSGEFIPIRWLPSETLQQLIYNTDTDVYMFGVFLWELMSLGRDPYYEYDLKGAYEAILSGQKLECPANCPQKIYNQMELCFRSQNERPCLDTVKSNLKKILEQL